MREVDLAASRFDRRGDARSDGTRLTARSPAAAARRPPSAASTPATGLGRRQKPSAVLGCPPPCGARPVGRRTCTCSRLAPPRPAAPSPRARHSHCALLTLACLVVAAGTSTGQRATSLNNGRPWKGAPRQPPPPALAPHPLRASARSDELLPSSPFLRAFFFLASLLAGAAQPTAP